MENLLFDYIARFMPLTDKEKTAITDLGIFKSYSKGKVLLKEGQYSGYGYFVVKGCLRTYYIKNNEERTTEFYTESQSLTPQCVLSKLPSEYYVACVEDCILVVANESMEKEIFEKFPRFETLCRLLSEQLLAQNQAMFDDFKISSPEERYRNLLEKRPDLVQRVPQYQLASYLGITPQSLSRLRARILKKQ